jgi:uncharacterized membrane protein HdeD (DUF308 family)
MLQSLTLKHASKGNILWGFLVVILGLFAMVSPAVSGLAVTFMLGTLLVIAGFAGVLFAFSSDGFGKGVLRFVFGGLTVLAGLIMFTQPGMALGTLTLFLAAYFVIDGIFSIFSAFQLETGKFWVILSGVLTLLLGAMIWQGWPVSGMWAVGILVGVKLIMVGMIMMALESTEGSIGSVLDR